MVVVRGVRVCLWKHLVIRCRSWRSTLVELLLPCSLFTILGAVYAAFLDHFGPTNYQERKREAVPLSDFGCRGRWEPGTLYFSPNSTAVTQIMTAVSSWINHTCCSEEPCFKTLCRKLSIAELSLPPHPQPWLELPQRRL